MRLWCCLAICGLTLGGLHAQSNETSLQVGRSDHEIAAGETQRFAVDLSAGQFARLMVDGRGTLAHLSITAPQDEPLGPLADRERRGGVREPIVWSFVADRTMRVSLAIESRESGGPTRQYSLTFERRAALPADRDRAAASRAVELAERLERSGAANAQTALAQYEAAVTRLHAAGDAREEARAQMDVGRLLAEAGRSREATQAFEQARDRCRSAADPSCEGAALHRLGRLLAFTGQPGPGIETLGAALDVRNGIHDEAGQAETLMELGSAEGTRSDNRRAVEYLDRALERAAAAADRRTQADVLNIRGVMEYGFGNPTRARELYESALTIRRAIGDEAGEGQSTSNLGVLHRSLGEPRVAIAYYEEALRVRRRLGAVQSIANTLHNMGVAHGDLSEHERALDLLREALDLWRQSGGRRGEAFTLQNIGQSYAHLGDPAKALEYYAQCMPLWKAVGEKRGEAQTLLAAAGLSTNRRDFARAIADYTTALQIATDAGYKREIGMALVGRGTARRLQGDVDAALADARQARDILRESGERREEGRALAEIGATLLQAGRVADASASYADALPLLESVEDRVGEAGVRSQLARTAELGGDAEEAARQATAALDLIESVRANLTAEGLSLSLFASKRQFYADAIDLLLRLHERTPNAGYDVAAFGVSERMRARALLDILAAGDVKPRQGREADLLSEIRRTQELINTKAVRLTRVLGAASTRTGAIATDARRELDDVLARLDVLRAQLRLSDPDFASLTAPVPLSLAQVQAGIDGRTVLLEYAVGDDRSHGWAVTESGHLTFDAPGRAELERSVRTLYAALAKAEVRSQKSDSGDTGAAADRRVRSAARALSTALLAPAAELLRTRSRIVVVADGVLQSLPFAALPSPTGASDALAATHEFIVLPSASVGSALRSRAASRAAPSTAIAVFADPVFSPTDTRVTPGDRAPRAASSLPRLRFSRLEADHIARLAPRRTTVWADFTANRSTALKPDLARFGIVHFAVHARIDDERPQLSSIVLSQVDHDGRPQDGLVRVHEVYNLSLNARLVVLSACSTALGRHVDGEGLIGLSRGFLHAGADAVVATLWAVDDRATAAFMTRFYDGLLGQRLSPAAALRSARRAMIQDPRWAAPQNWAAFVLIGESGSQD
jgi:CHAT domain-containing protein/tetratricopeptide (TPR) repeat protein